MLNACHLVACGDIVFGDLRRDDDPRIDLVREHEKGRIRRVKIVVLARKLLITLWRFAEIGSVPSDVKFA